jgi:hypothetical protein
VALKHVDRLIFSYMKKRKFTNAEIGRILGITKQSIHTFKSRGIPERHYVTLLKVLGIPSDKVMESIREDFRI